VPLPATARGRNYSAVAGVGGGELYAGQVEDALESGVARKLASGEELEYVSPGSGRAAEDMPELDASGRVVRRKPPVVWHPAYSGNFTSANRGAAAIDRIVIHITEGTWSSAINWFQTPGAGASAHYIVSSRVGRIAQCVSDINIAWHAGNWFVNSTSIGIEHEAFDGYPAWYTKAMYRSSARLVAYLRRRYNIPLRRTYIFGHTEIPGVTKTCPGRYWWWSYYMRLVRAYARR
jgi:hypothetical protein